MNHRRPRKKGAITGVLLTGAIATTTILNPATASAAPSPLDEATRLTNQFAQMFNGLSAPVANDLANALNSSISDMVVSPLDNGMTDMSWVFDPNAAARNLGIDPSGGLSMIRLPKGADLSNLTVERIRGGVSEVIPLSVQGVPGVSSNGTPGGALFGNGINPSRLSDADFRSAFDDLVRSGSNNGIFPKGTTPNEVLRQITGNGMLSSGDLNSLLSGDVESMSARAKQLFENPFALIDAQPGDKFKISTSGSSDEIDPDTLMDQVKGAGSFKFADLAEQMPDSPLKPFFVDFAKRLDETVDVWTRPMDNESDGKDEDGSGKDEDGKDGDILDEMSFNDAMKVYDAVDSALAEREKSRNEGGNQGGQNNSGGQNNGSQNNTVGNDSSGGNKGGSTIRDGVKTVPASNNSTVVDPQGGSDPKGGSDSQGATFTHAQNRSSDGAVDKTVSEQGKNVSETPNYPPATDPNAPDSLPVTGASEGTAAMGWAAGILAALGVSVAWASRRGRAADGVE